MSTLILLQVLFIILIHWIADFLLQTQDMATKKSTSIYWLSKHIFAYILGTIPTALMVWIVSHSLMYALLWLIINGILHWITDYYTSRWTSKLYVNQQFYAPNKYIKFFNFPAFFSVIGLDQVIHYSCLFITYVIFT